MRNAMLAAILAGAAMAIGCPPRPCTAPLCSDACTASLGPHVLVGSTFVVDDEGWRMLGGDFAAPTPPVWNPCQVRAEGQGPWSWIAPAKFHGDLSAALGGAIEFDWEFKNSSASLTEIPLVIGGAGLTLEWRNTIPRWDDTTCHSFSAGLDASEPWFDAATDARATEEQLRAVLEAVSLLQIRGNDGVGGSSLCGVRIVE